MSLGLLCAIMGGAMERGDNHEKQSLQLDSAQLFQG